MFEINSGKVAKAQKVVIYGVEGVGKSTLASRFPNVLFIDLEGSTNNMDVKRIEKPTSWTMLLSQLDWIKSTKPCKSLVIDTADYLEEYLCKPYIVSTIPNSKGAFVKNIEDYGYGAGYKLLGETWGKDLLNRLTEVTNAGVNVIVIAHATQRKVDLPDEMGAYDRYELKLEKKTAALTKEWADIVLFCNFKTEVITLKDGMKTSRKGQGQTRKIFTDHHAAWDAKNRHGLPEELDLDYKYISHIFSDNTNKYYKTSDGEVIEAPKDSKAEKVFEQMRLDPEVPKEAVPQEISKDEFKEILDKDEREKVPFDEVVPDRVDNKALSDLMRINGISKAQIEAAVAFRGFMPRGMDLNDYPKDFIEQMLVGQFDRVKQIIIENNL